MKSMRGLLVGTISFVVCLGLLFVFYPWSIYFGNFTYSEGSTLASYLLLALVVGLISSATVLVFPFHLGRPAGGQGALTGIILFLAYCGSSLLLGPLGVEILNTRVRGIFFSEWKFVGFDIEIALPLSMIGAAVVWWTLHKERQTSRTTTTTAKPFV
jgi:hypothetical protein